MRREFASGPGSVNGEAVVVIGAGPAGSAAAIQCRRLGIAALLLDRTGVAGGLVENAYRIENYPGLPEPPSGPEFAERLRDHLGRFGVSVKKAEVTGVVREGRRFLVTHASGALSARAVIVASGTEPRRVEIEGADAIEGTLLFYEVRSLLRRHPNPRDIVIIGGGEAACDYARTLAAIGATVHLVIRAGHVKARGMLANAIARDAAVRVSLSTVCDRISVSPRLSVTLRDTAAGAAREQPADAILAAAGRRSAAPRILEPLGASIADCAAGLIPGLFIAGDARDGSLGQIAMAAGDGLRAAAATAAFLEKG